MTSKRKFYKTTLKIEILSEEPFEWDSIDSIAYSITEGDCSGNVDHVKSEILTAKKVVQELINQGSDSEFFQLDEDGNDI